MGVRFPLPAPATLVSTGYDRLPSTSLVFRDTFQGRKGFAHEQARVRVEVCPCWQEVALLQTVRRQERENRAQLVIVKGREEHHPEGNFYLHRYEGNREIWKKIGPSAQEAVNAADFESTYLTARAKGIPIKANRYAYSFDKNSCPRVAGRRETLKSARNP